MGMDEIATDEMHQLDEGQTARCLSKIIKIYLLILKKKKKMPKQACTWSYYGQGIIIEIKVYTVPTIIGV